MRKNYLTSSVIAMALLWVPCEVSAITATQGLADAVSGNMTGMPARATAAMSHVQFVGATPASGATVVELSQIVTRWAADDLTCLDAVYTKNYVEVLDKDGNKVTDGSFARMGGDDEVRLRLSQAITTPGKYTVKILPGAVYILDWDTFMPAEGSENELVTLEYNVVDMEPVTFEGATPASGSSLIALKQIDLQLGGGDPLFGIECGSKDMITVYDASGNAVTNGVVRNMPSGYVLRLSDEVTTPGQYTIEVEKGALWAIDDNFQQVFGTENERFTLEYNVVDMEPVTFEGATPASGSSLIALSQIGLELKGGDPLFGIECGPKDLISVYDASGNTVTNGVIRNMPTGYVLRLSEDVTTPGQYTIEVSKGALWAIDDNFQQVYGTENERFTLEYNVVEMQPVTFEGATPASGTTLAVLSQVGLELGGGDPMFGIQCGPKDMISVYDAAGNTVTNGMIANMPTGYVLRLSEDVTTPGQYTIEVEKGALWAVDDNMEQVYGTENERFTIEYNVVDASPIEFVGATPADNESVKTLDAITTTWKGGVADAACKISNPTEVVTVANEAGVVAVEATLSRGEVGYDIVFKPAIDTKGTYTVTIAEGALQALDAEGNEVYGITSPAVELTYTVLGNEGSLTDLYNGGKLTVNGSVLTLGAEAKVAVYNLCGTEVFKGEGTVIETGLGAGVYVVKAEYADSTETTKIIIR